MTGTEEAPTLGSLAEHVEPGTYFAMDAAERERRDREMTRKLAEMSEASDEAVLAAHFPDSSVHRRNRVWYGTAPDGEELVSTGPAGLAWQLIRALHRLDTAGEPS